MPETKDPVESLRAASIPERAAAARDLSQAGTPDHIDALIHTGIHDKSPGVRLAAASAAADILSRHRLSPRREKITDAQREGWLRAAASVDPVVNPGLFGICGCLGTEAAFKRILQGLRDPRQDVRTGACVGLWRTMASGGAALLPGLEAQVVATLSDARIRVETRVEIARLCADAGYLTALEPARELPALCTRKTNELADAIVLRLEALPQPAGLWVRTGMDPVAIDPKCDGDDVLLVLGLGDAVTATAKGVRRGPLSPGWRILSIRENAKESAESVLQIGTESWWPAPPEAVVRFGDRLLQAGQGELLLGVGEALGGSSSALRVRGCALLALGRADEAVLALEAAVAGKKVPPDAWWFLADALRATGKADAARPHLETFISRAPKRAPQLEEAKKRLAEG